MAKKPSKGAGGARKTATKDLETRLIDAMLDIAARDGWQGVTLPAVAAGAGAKLSELYPDWRSRTAVLEAFTRRIDRAVVETDFAFAPEDTARDRLFEVLMGRFDALQPHREAIRRIRSGVARDALESAATMRRLACSMAWMLEAAKLSTEGVAGKAKIAGLTALWMRCLGVWVDDDSKDMSRTMAALDRGLARVDRCAEVVFCRRRAGKESNAEAA